MERTGDLSRLRLCAHRFPVACMAALAGLAAAAVEAHHGVANFDLNADVALEGTIERVEFLNPHSWLYLSVADAGGDSVQWRCEMRGATVLMRSGWSESMFVPGQHIRVTGSPDRKDPATCYFGSAVFADGSSVDRYGQLEKPAPTKQGQRPAQLADGQPNISGDWATEQVVMTDPRGQMGTLVPLSQAAEYAPGETPGGGPGFPGARGTAISLADDPVDAYWNERPTSMPLTDAGKAAIEGLDFSTGDNPRLRCAPTNILFDWYFEEDVNRIVQTGTAIKLYYGSMGIERTIHLDQTTHPAGIEPSLAGHSIGHWEGNTLVVDTVGFAPGILNADGRVPHSANLHVVERFTLDPARPSLVREYTAEDPDYFVGTFRGSDTMLVADLPYHGTTPCEDRTRR